MTIEIKRMWPTGPLRQWSNDPVHRNSWNLYQCNSSHGFVGSYVCDDCREPVVGVYRQKRSEKWLCKACHVATGGSKHTPTIKRSPKSA